MVSGWVGYFTPSNMPFISHVDPPGSSSRDLVWTHSRDRPSGLVGDLHFGESKGDFEEAGR